VEDARATSGSTGRHGHLRPPGDRVCRWVGGWTSARCCSGTRTTVPAPAS
jgi:hypothetical protein